MEKNVLNTDLTGKVAVVTGAGGVLCSAFAKTLARAGAAVALLDLNDVAAEGYDAVIPAMLSGLPDILIAIVVILVLSASMSTLSGLVLASSSTLTLDFIKGTLVKDLSQKKQLLISVLSGIFLAIHFHF